MVQDLALRIMFKEAKVGIIGLGYVGLPLAIHFTQAGFPVTGFDTDKNKVQKINKGESYISHIPSFRIASLIGHNHQGLRTMDRGFYGYYRCGQTQKPSIPAML